MNDDAQGDDLAQKIQEAEAQEQVAAAQAEAQATAGAEAQKKIEELTNALARCLADSQNMKRRAEEDRFRTVKFANAELLKAIIPVVDNFDRSAQHLPENLKEDAWAAGVVRTHDDLIKVLEKIGVQKMKTAGEKLNPKFHEAVMSGPGEKDLITAEFEPGYTYNDEVLKPARVKVGDGTFESPAA